MADMCSLVMQASPDAVPSPTLQDIYQSGHVQDATGARYPLHSHLPPPFTSALYRTVKKERPALVVEIGMAFGLSSLAILAALRETGGTLISIDPYQSTDWHGVGIANVARDGMSGQHCLLEQADYLALPTLLEQGKQVDLAYIDGYHTFDYCTLDWFLCDKLLRVGGLLAFNDCHWFAVQRSIRCLQVHRRYDEIAVGLPAIYYGRNRAFRLANRLLRRSAADRYFRKREAWEPSWNFYRRF